MYLSFYKLKEKPFNISTDPRFLWYGEKHQEALANLKYGLLEGNGYVVLTGDVGMGKTTLVNALIEALDDSVLVANINHPTLDTIDFLSLIARTYDASAEIASKTDFLLFFKSFLQRTYIENKIALLIIDEAHRLSKELLEEIRLLSNMEESGNKLINIFFVGQNELKVMLLSPECHALRQRITLFYDLFPLSEDETMSYVAHRLKVAGTEEQLFTPGAIHQIQNFTRGYPRLINIICDRAMLTGYVKEQKQIDADIVAECAREISFLDPTASKTETIELDRLSRWDSPPVSGLSTPAGELENNTREKPTDGKVRYHVKSVKNISDQNTGSFLQQNRRKLIPLGLAAAIVFLVVAVGIGVNTKWNVKPDESVQVDQTFHEKKTGGPDLRAAQDAPEAAKLMLKQEPAQKGIEPEKENSPVNPISTVTVNASLGKKPAPEKKPKKQNKPTKPASAKRTPKKTTKASQPANLELAIAALEQQNFNRAIELFEADRSRDTGNSQKAMELYSKALAGRAGQIIKESPSAAEDMLRKAVKADPENVRAYFTLGKIYTGKKKYSRAIDAYQKAVALDPGLADAIFNLGFIHATTGKYKKAEEFFARVVQLNPSYLDKALFNLALVQEKLGKKQESLANLQEAVAVRPENQKVRAYLNQVFNAKEDL